jgi:hypothetical protein
MAQKLKRWESPRKQGRNIKGKGGSARARQLRKQQQLLRKKLKQENLEENQKKGNNCSPFFISSFLLVSLNIRTNSFGNSTGRWLFLPTQENLL